MPWQRPCKDDSLPWKKFITSATICMDYCKSPEVCDSILISRDIREKVEIRLIIHDPEGKKGDFMELQIQDLVSSIKKEGIDAAQAEAEAILADARKKAEDILADARSQAEAFKTTSEKEINTMRESAILSADQAKRDAVLAFEAEVKREFERLLSADIRKSLTDESLARLIQAALQGEAASDYAAEVAEVTDALKAQLAEEIRQGLEIRPTKGVKAGFKLAAKDGSGYFDCTEEEIRQMLTPYLRTITF